MKKKIEKLLKEVLNLPHCDFMMHIALATSEYTTIDEISDKELVNMLEKYLATQEIDSIISEDKLLSLEEEDEDAY